jgi:Phosphotransferase enzyme family
MRTAAPSDPSTVALDGRLALSEVRGCQVGARATASRDPCGTLGIMIYNEESGPGRHFVKRRPPPAAGSISAALGTGEAELRFYQEIAPLLAIRVPAYYQSRCSAQGTVLVLEDLSDWAPGADPALVAGLLSEHHRCWEGRARSRWPWLRYSGDGADLVGQLFDQTWARLASLPGLSAGVRRLGESLVGKVRDAERAEAGSGPATLLHGDASLANVRTGPDSEVVFLDWEDVRTGAGETDLAWLLVSSVEASRWGEVIAAYGPATYLVDVLPSAGAQGLLSLADAGVDSEKAAPWVERLEAASLRIFQ